MKSTLMYVEIARHFTIIIILQLFSKNIKNRFSGKDFKRVMHWLLPETGNMI